MDELRRESADLTASEARSTAESRRGGSKREAGGSRDLFDDLAMPIDFETMEEKEHMEDMAMRELESLQPRVKEVLETRLGGKEDRAGMLGLRLVQRRSSKRRLRRMRRGPAPATKGEGRKEPSDLASHASAASVDQPTFDDWVARAWADRGLNPSTQVTGKGMSLAEPDGPSSGPVIPTKLKLEYASSVGELKREEEREERQPTLDEMAGQS